MNLHQTLLRAALGIALLLGASQAPALELVTVSLLPSTQNAIPTQTVNLALTISGLGDHNPSSFGGFDINLFFDSSKLTFTGYNLSNLLGAVGTEADDLSIGATGNTINLAQLSYLSPSELATLQPSEFTFATLSFRVDNLPQFQQTFVFFDLIKVLSDENGDPLQIASLNGAQIGNPIPEPPTLLLFGLGLALLIRNRRRV